MVTEAKESDMCLTYTSLAIAISAAITIFIPLLALSLGLSGLILSWHVKLTTIPDSKARKIANAAILISVTVLAILFLGAMGLIAIKSSTEVFVEKMH
ncbi:MAG: hypothetical protein QMD53_06820 [Actinomycetota bacterium]|nr:hypothetical protein [Actinomycetota bacterium]